MQTDILNLMRNGQWRQDGGMLVPAYLTKYMLSPLDVSGIVYTTHSEVLGQKYTQEELKEALSQLSVEDCIGATSMLLTLLENEGRTNVNTQIIMVQTFFEGKVKEKVINLLQREPKRLVFFETQLLLLAKYAILYAKNEPSNNFGERKLFSTYMEAVLGVTDVLDEKTEGKTEPELQREAIRSIYFNSRPHLLYSLTRTLDLFITIPNELTTHHQHLDIPTLFQEATGLPIETYLFLGLALTTLPMEQKLGRLKAENWSIIPEKYFLHTRVSKDEVSLIVKEFSIDIQALKNIYRDQNNFEYNFNGIVQHPLVTFNKQIFFPLPLSLLKDKITVQVYWILFDYIKKQYKKNLQTYTNFMGACFEEYVYRLLRRIYPSSLLGDRLIREITYLRGKKEFKTADNILINPSSLILLETKISQLKVYLTGVVGDLDAFREDAGKIVVDSFKTMQRTKEDFQKGLLQKDLPVEPKTIQTFYPIVIAYGPFVQFPLVWKIVKEEIMKIPDYDSELLNNLQIIQADELEILEAFLEGSGISLEKLIQNKIADPVYKELSFHIYLDKEYGQFRHLRSKYLIQTFDAFGDRLSLKMFGKIIPTSEENDV
jgi:hypothetical protein